VGVLVIGSRRDGDAGRSGPDFDDARALGFKERNFENVPTSRLVTLTGPDHVSGNAQRSAGLSPHQQTARPRSGLSFFSSPSLKT